MISRNFKNVLVVSVGFLFLFTAYEGLQSLQVDTGFRIPINVIFLFLNNLSLYLILKKFSVSDVRIIYF